jgi:hypothetical protein
MRRHVLGPASDLKWSAVALVRIGELLRAGNEPDAPSPARNDCDIAEGSRPAQFYRRRNFCRLNRLGRFSIRMSLNSGLFNCFAVLHYQTAGDRTHRNNAFLQHAPYGVDRRTGSLNLPFMAKPFQTFKCAASLVAFGWSALTFTMPQSQICKRAEESQRSWAEPHEYVGSGSSDF